jgi:hypothetical protein
MGTDVNVNIKHGYEHRVMYMVIGINISIDMDVSGGLYWRLNSRLKRCSTTWATLPALWMHLFEALRLDSGPHTC